MIDIEQRVSLSTTQGHLLKIAQQQREIQGLEARLAFQRSKSLELEKRWDQVRIACAALSDDSVKEVLGKIQNLTLHGPQ